MDSANPISPQDSPRRVDQEDFIYRVSHDLRSPISTILGFSELLVADHAAQLSPEAQRYLQTVKQAAYRLNGMIEGLLAYSRIGRAPDGPRMCDMNVVIACAKSAAIRRVSRPDAVLRIQPALPKVYGVESEYQSLFTQLIVNALQYNSKPGPVVEICCAETPDEFAFSVRDNGPGIDPKHHQTIFKVFVRLAPHSQEASVGMGLALAQRIVELHRGKIRIESGKEQGSTFVVTLPKAAAKA